MPDEPPPWVAPTSLPNARPAVGIPSAGKIIGYVAGGVTDGHQRSRRWGAAAAVTATVLAIPFALADLIMGRHWVLPDLVALMLGAGAAAWLVQRLRTPDGLRLVAGAWVPRRAFTLRPVTGGEVPCAIDGDLGQVRWRHGDALGVTGRLRSGTFVAARVELLESPGGPALAVVTGQRLSWSDRLGWGAAVVVAAFVLVLLTGLA